MASSGPPGGRAGAGLAPTHSCRGLRSRHPPPPPSVSGVPALRIAPCSCGLCGFCPRGREAACPRPGGLGHAEALNHHNQGCRQAQPPPPPRRTWLSLPFRPVLLCVSSPRMAYPHKRPVCFQQLRVCQRLTNKPRAAGGASLGTDLYAGVTTGAWVSRCPHRGLLTPSPPCVLHSLPRAPCDSGRSISEPQRGSALPRQLSW